MRPLLRLHEALDGSRTVTEICRSIYDHLVDLEITAKLEADGKDDEVRAFNCLCEALDVMDNAIGSRKMGAKLFLGLFTIVVGQTAIGTLPSTIDEITVGSADLTRATGISHAYVIGVNEECFPKSVSQNSFFSDNDKAYLETCGINLSPSIESDLCDELYYFYKAVAIPSKTLTVTCVLFDKNGAAVRKSVAFNRIAHILGKNMVEESSKISLNNTVFTTESGLHALCGDETEETAAIRRALSTDSDAASLLNAQTQSFYSDADAEGISEEVMKIIYPGDMKLSQSKLDKIALCPMSYQLSYALRLKEEKRATFQANDSGILVHRIVEVFFRNVSTEDGVKSLTDEEIDEMIDDILNDYLASIFGNKTLENVSKRAMNLFKRLKRTAKVVIKNLLEEFSQSDFVPRFFELPIEASDEDATVKSIDFKLFDGTKASLIGTVDRVDVCEKNNKLYVRVVDYKTGNKTFDLADVAQGFNLQMLLYLFSIWKDGNGKFKKSLNFDGDIIPAGVLYLIAKTPSLEEEPSTDPATIYRLAAEKITRNGLLIKDEDILRMMEKKLEGKYIPIKEASDNAMKNRKKLADSLGIVNNEIFSDSSLKSLATLEEMGALLNQITDTVTKLANEIKSGNASCSPIRNDKHDSCKYCPHKAICRNPKSFEKISKY